MTTLSTFTNLIQTRHLFYVDYLKILISFLDSPLFPFFQPYLKRAADVILLNPKLDCSCPLLKIIQWFYFSFRIKEGSLFQKWSTSPCLVCSSLYSSSPLYPLWIDLFLKKFIY